MSGEDERRDLRTWTADTWRAVVDLKPARSTGLSLAMTSFNFGRAMTNAGVGIAGFHIAGDTPLGFAFAAYGLGSTLWTAFKATRSWQQAMGQLADQEARDDSTQAAGLGSAWRTSGNLELSRSEGRDLLADKPAEEAEALFKGIEAAHKGQSASPSWPAAKRRGHAYYHNRKRLSVKEAEAYWEGAAGVAKGSLAGRSDRGHALGRNGTARGTVAPSAGMGEGELGSVGDLTRALGAAADDAVSTARNLARFSEPFAAQLEAFTDELEGTATSTGDDLISIFQAAGQAVDSAAGALVEASDSLREHAERL